MFIIGIPIYHQDVLISINQSDETLVENLVNAGIIDLDPDSISSFVGPLINKDNHTAARTVYYPDNGTIALRVFDLDVTSSLGVGTVIHELSHATSFIFERIGMEHNKHTDEAYSYLIGYLSQKFYENV